MFISSLHAQSAAAAGGFDFTALMPFALIIGVFYFLIIRPQSKRNKERQEMIGNIRRGDRIVTAGGIIGSVHAIVSDTELEVEISKDTIVRIARGTVSQVMDKTVPISNDDKPKKKTPARKPAKRATKTATKTAAKKTVSK